MPSLKIKKMDQESLIKPFNIDVAHFVRLKKVKIQFEALYVLHLIVNNVPLPPEALNSKDWLRRKGYITDNLDVTVYGKELHASLTGNVTTELRNAVNAAKVSKEKDIQQDSFDKWWAVFPASSYFEWKGKTFKGTRTLKTGKENCRKLFTVLCNSHFRAEDIIRATKYHMDAKREESVVKRINQIDFVANSERYLRERMFEPFISISLKKQTTNEEGAPENRVISL